jgi:hypothetical protein
MGLLLHFKKNQIKSWGVFFQHALDVWDLRKIIVLPLGHTGYGFAGNPFNLGAWQAIKAISPTLDPTQVYFMTNSYEIIQQIVRISTLAIETAKKWWPGDIAISESPQMNYSIKYKTKNYPLSRDIYAQFTKMQILMPNEAIGQELLRYLASHNFPPVILFYLPLLPENQPYIDISNLMNDFNHESVAAYYNGGKLQKKPPFQGPTVVEFGENARVEIIDEGIVPRTELLGETEDS